MRIVFFGSPEYAVPSLRACLDLPGAEVVAVVTQPDRPRGRSGATQMTPVKELAIEAGVPVILQPERARRDLTDALTALNPDVGVVAASGHLLPTHLLEAFPHGVLNVHAMDKAGGKSNKITITNDKGRLSKEDIERMVSEAEKYKEEDSRHKERIDARNGLENYIYSVKNSTDLKEKLSEEERGAIEAACKESLAWLESANDATTATDDYAAQQKKLEGIVAPIVSKLYGQGQGQGQGGATTPSDSGPGSGSGAGASPSVEEVD
ncbi:MAG: Hsp70 family protein [Chloroflexota bacterium]